MPAFTLESSVIVESSMIRLAVRPDLGGRITSLVDRRSGREWLWQNPYLPARPALGTESYTAHLDAGGWDEILPSVAACRLADGRKIPDHGDIVRLPARVVSAGEGGCILATQLKSLPLRLTRELIVEREQLTIHYTLQSMAEEAVPYLWAAHPLLALEPGMKLLGISGTDFIHAGSQGAFAGLDGVIPDFRSPDFQPYACKLFFHAPATGRLGLLHPDGSALELAWAAEDIPWLGLWLNLGAWSGCGSAPYFNLGLEPTTSPHDSLADAVLAGEAMVLGAGETRCWSLRVSLH